MKKFLLKSFAIFLLGLTFFLIVGALFNVFLMIF